MLSIRGTETILVSIALCVLGVLVSKTRGESMLGELMLSFVYAYARLPYLKLYCNLFVVVSVADGGKCARSFIIMFDPHDY